MKTNSMILVFTMTLALNLIAQATESQISNQQLADSIRQAAQVMKFKHNGYDVTAYENLDRLGTPIKSFTEQGYIDVAVHQICKLLGHESGLRSSAFKNKSIGISKPTALVNVLAGQDSYPIRMGKMVYRSVVSNNYKWGEETYCEPGSEKCAAKPAQGEHYLATIGCKN